MDHISQSDEESTIDLECGETANELAGFPDLISGNKQGLPFLNTVCNGPGSSDGSGKGENGVSYINNLENVSFLINQKVDGEESADLSENKWKDRRKSTSTKKPPKPPRPPRGLSLDAADQKLVKEIAEVAMLKRARIERMKALKKMKATKGPSSSNGSLFAMLFTIFFCLVIIFQGMSSQSSSSVGFHGSVESARAAKISLKFALDCWNSSSSISGSGTPSLVGEVSGSDPNRRPNKAVG